MYRSLEQLNSGSLRVRVITNSPATGANPSGCADLMNQRDPFRQTGTEVYEYAGEHSSHAKTILVDDRISIIGSFNLDMRSTYLDTEMMLAVDCPELNEHLRELDTEYMEQSICHHPDGTVTEGSRYTETSLSFSQKLFYGIFRILILPVRQLL